MKVAGARLGRVGPQCLALWVVWSLSGDVAAAQRPTTGAKFGDGAVLLSAVAGTAIERNREIIDAEQELALADGQVAEAWSDVYPSVALSSSYTRNVAPQVSFLPAQIFDPTAAEGDFIPVQFGADNIWSLSVNLEQTLFDPQVFVGLGAAARFRLLQREVVRGRTQQIVTRVRIAFYDLLLAQEEVRLTDNSLQRVRRSLDETRAMLEAGVSETYDVLRLEVEVANLEPSLSRARNRLRAARRALVAELDLDPDAEIEVAGELASMDLEDFEANSPANRDILAFRGEALGFRGETPGFRGEGFRGEPFRGEAPWEDPEVAALLRRGMTDRSDIRQLELAEALRKTELRIEQSDYLPNVSAFGSYGLAAQQNGAPDFFGTSRQRGTTKQVGLRVTMPIFSGFRENARISQRQAALRQAEVQTRLATDQAEIQLRNLLDQVGEARQRTRGQRLAVSQAGRGFEIASARYREGLAGQLELMDAEVALRQSEFNYAQAIYDYLSTGARLDEAAGTVPLVDVAMDEGAVAQGGNG